jgi:hypothetical protein
MIRFGRIACLVAAVMVMCAMTASAADVVEVEGSKPAKVKKSVLVRIKASGIAGAEIKATVTGAGKLDHTNNIRQIKNGQPVIGSTIKEFMIKPKEKGTIKVKVSVKNPTADKPEEKEYEIEVE